MRGNVPLYDLRTPRSLREALGWMSAEPGRYRPFAGGTDLMVLLESGQLRHHEFISLWGLPELKGIDVHDDRVTLGALTTYSEIVSHPVLRDEFPNLVRAARETGAWAIQNRGTLGGNIANASPAADSVPALLAYGAELELASAKGSRRVAYETFHTGYKTTLLKPEEVVRAVHLPRGPAREAVHYFRKVGTRKAQSISKVCLAAWILTDARGAVRDLRLVYGSVGPVAVRARATEAALKGQRPADAAAVARALAALDAEIAPIDDIRSTREYRKRVAGNLLAECLRAAGKS